MSRPARDLSVRTPGAPAAPAEAPAAPVEAANPTPTAEQIAAEEAELEAEIAGASLPIDTAAAKPEASAPAAPGSVAELQAFIAAEVKKGVDAGIKAFRREQLRATPGAAPIPDQSEVDPKKITETVLTKQGYVIPASYGAVPEHIRSKIQLGQSF